MCLIVLARAMHPDYPLILLAHRDEFTARPSAPLHWWPDTAVLAGRDQQAGGGWLGVNRTGQLAAVTNVRQGPPEASARSRGELVTEWLDRPAPPERFAENLSQAAQYSGFNLLFGTWQNGQLQLHYASNRFQHRQVPEGLSALSNGDFDAPWPKVRHAKQQLANLLSQSTEPTENWLDSLANVSQAADADLPDTGIGLERERWLSPMQITGPHYGTRAASLLALRRDGVVTLIERTLDPARGGVVTGVVYEQVRWS